MAKRKTTKKKKKLSPSVAKERQYTSKQKHEKAYTATKRKSVVKKYKTKKK